MGNYLAGSGKEEGVANKLVPMAISGNAASFKSECSANEGLVSKLDRQRNTVLHGLFTVRDVTPGHSEIFELVRSELGGDNGRFLEMLATKNDLGCNVLWIGVAYQAVDLLQKLESVIGKDELKRLISVTNLQGDTGILAACSRGGEASLLWLRSLYGDGDRDALLSLLCACNKNGTDVVQTVCSGSHLQTAKVLRDLLPAENWGRADSKRGLYPLHVAVERGWQEGVELILSIVGSDGTAVRDLNGATPLHVAAFVGHCSCVSPLINADADIEARDGSGRTALWLAKLKGFDGVATLLEEAGAKDNLKGMAEEIEQSDTRRREAERKRDEQNIAET